MTNKITSEIAFKMHVSPKVIICVLFLQNILVRLNHFSFLESGKRGEGNNQELKITGLFNSMLYHSDSYKVNYYINSK